MTSTPPPFPQRVSGVPAHRRLPSLRPAATTGLPVVAAVVLLGLASSGCGSGGSAAVERLTASGAWARSTPPGAENGVVYVTVASPDATAIVAAAVPSDVAAAAELHETMVDDGSGMGNMPGMDHSDTEGGMTMEPVASVPVPAGGEVSFEPGGKHIMLTGLADPLESGEHFTLTLTMADGATLPVDVVVSDNEPGT